MSDSTVKYPASLVPVGAFAGKPAMPLTRQMIVVGSSKHSRILLKSDTVSSVHTLLILSNGRWYFRDLVSRTHTILNGKSVREAELKNGDTITIGAFVFHFVAPEPKDPVIKVPPAALDITDAEIPVPIDTKTVLIGKRPGCEVRLLEEGVSTAHAILFECNGVHYVRDLYSRGGTFLNGTKIHQEPLKFGDVVVVGDTTLRYIPDRSAEAELPNLLDDTARPVILHDDPMASHDAPLVARDLTLVVPLAISDEPSRSAEIIAPPAKAPVESSDAPSDLRKPAEIRANLPAGLSSLLDTAGLASADAFKAPVEFEPRRDLFEPLPIDEADDLVVPLRRREPAEETPKAVVDDIEPSSIAPEIDEVRLAASNEIAPAEEVEEPSSISADLDEAILLPDDAIPVADEDRDEAIDLADVGPAVANRPLEVDEAREVVAAEPMDLEIEPAVIEPVAAEPKGEISDASIDVVDEAELSVDVAELAVDEAELSDVQVVPASRGPADDVASTVVTLPPEPVNKADELSSKSDEQVDVETEALATADDAVVTRDEVVAEEVITTDAIVVADEVAAPAASAPLEIAPAVQSGPVSKELAELAAEIQATLARTVAPPAAMDRPVAEVPAAEKSDAEEPESTVPPLDVKAFAEQIRRDFAAEDAKAESEKADVPLEPEADVETKPQDKPQEQLELVADAPSAASPLETIEQSPELRQLADLQARIAAALEDPSSVVREPILPPGASLVSDPDTAMNAAARRARLIAEMLEDSEPIEEEAEREAQSISFEIDESAIPPSIEPIAELESPPIVAEIPPVADAEAVVDVPDVVDDVSELDTNAATLESSPVDDALDAADLKREEDLKREKDLQTEEPAGSLDEASILLASDEGSLSDDEVVPTHDDLSLANDEVSLAKDEVSLAKDEVSLGEDDVSLANQDAGQLEALTPLEEEVVVETVSLEPTDVMPAASIDTADTLPADLARGDEVAAVPSADLIETEKADAYPTSASVPDTADVADSGSAMPSAVELSELPVFDAPAEVEFKSEAAPANQSIELELPAPEALGAPLDLDEIEPTLQGSIRDEEATRDQDVFDQASIGTSAIRIADDGIAEETPVDGALLDTDEIRETGEILDVPASAAPTLDASEPVSESADDQLAGESILAEEQASESLETDIAASEMLEPIAEVDAELLDREIDAIAEPIEVDVVEVDAETAEAIEDEIFAQQDEKPALKVETPETTAELATQPDEIAVEVNDPIAPVEADEFNAGEVIITGVDVGPEAAPQEETPVKAQPTFELPAAIEETPVIAEPALTNDIATDRVILEAEEEEPLERQSRPLIAADEHLVEDEIEELAVAQAIAEVEAAIPPTAEQPEPTLVAESVASDIAFDARIDEGPENALPTIEVDVTSAQIGEPFDQSTNPFAQEAPAPAPLTPLEPAVAEGTLEAARRPVMVEDPSMTGIDKPRAMNIAVPSLDELQAEFDDAFADALAMAEGKSFASEPKDDPAAEIAKPFETISEQERSLAESAKPPVSAKPQADEVRSEETPPTANIKPMGPRQGNVVNVKIPSLEKLEADFRDSFAEALAMAEGQSFSKPKFEARDKPEVAPAPAQPAAEAPATKPTETRAPAKPARKLPEFKLDESLLDQAEKMGPVGGSPAPMGPAAFMNLGGIGWIGDETLDDFETVSRKPAKPKRRSRQRRPVGDQLSKPETTAEASVERGSQTAESLARADAFKPASLSEMPASAERSDIDRDVTLTTDKRVASDDSTILDRAGDASEVEESGAAAAAEAVLADDERVVTESTAATTELYDLVAGQIENDELLSPSATTDADAPESELEVVDEVASVESAEELADVEATEKTETPRAIADPKPLPTVIPPRPNRPRKGQAVVDQALSTSSGSPFAAQELPLVDAFSGAATPQLDEVLARLNTSGGAVKDHPPISQDRPLSNGSEVKVPVSPFASQIPIAQPAGSVRRIRQRVSKLPLIVGLMLIATIASGTLTWFIPVPRTVRGEVKFKNLDRTTELVRKEMQRNILGKLPDLQQAARQHVEDFEGGFLDLDRREAWDEIVRKAHFDSQVPSTLVLEVPSNVNQSKADEKRLAAVITEFVKANKDLNDEVNKGVDETREIERARAELDTQLSAVKKRYDELGAIYESGTVTSTALKKVERELAALDENRKRAVQELESREAELKTLEAQMLSNGILFRGNWMRAVPGIVLADASGAVPSADPIDAAADLARLQREREDVKARIDRLTAARSPETAAARESFDRALDAFSKQVEEARNTLGDRPEVLKYVQSATKLQDQIREMTDTLVRRQEQQITRLNEFQLKLKEHTQSTRDERINGDPELKSWMDDLAFQERRLNVARESNANEEDIRDLERNISFLKSNIAAKQELLADPKEAVMVGDIQSMIDATQRDMATDRQRNDAVLAEVQNVFKSNQPVLEALPVEQRQVTQGLTERLAQIDLARQRYTDSLAIVAGSDDTLIADARKQLESLDSEIATVQARAQREALVHSQEMEKRTEIARRVEEARAKVLEARTAWEELDKQYRSKIEARDVLAAKVTDWKAAAAERDVHDKRKSEMEKRQGELIVRRKAIEERLAFAVVPDPTPKIHVLSGQESDPRLKYFMLSMLGIVAVGAGLMTMEVRNRIPVPQQNGDETSDSQTPPLSGTPTVA